MMKVLYKPTRTVTLVPDEEALEIMKNDTKCEYQIVGAGFQEGAEITYEDTEIRRIPPMVVVKPNLAPEKKEKSLLECMSRGQLYLLCKKLGYKYCQKWNKAQYIKAINDYKRKEE